MINKNIWLIGTGQMALDYSKVLQSLNCSFSVIGRSEEGSQKFFGVTGVKPITGGLKEFLKTNPEVPQAVIVAVGIEALKEITLMLIDYNVKHILLEKPGVGYAEEINDLSKASSNAQATVLLAYNRRFYTSVLKAKELIKEDDGLMSFNFEFTEWAHVIKGLSKHKAEHNNWFLGNSTHVIDTAFFLGGKPDKLSAFYKGGLEWHPTSSIFSGAGESVKGALFSYHANWEAPGRWVLELLTKKRRFIFKPMESLQLQELGSVAINPVELDDQLDKDFKPGLYLQTRFFLEEKLNDFCTVYEQQDMINSVYKKMSGY